MGLQSRDISVEYDGHEIALSVAIVGRMNTDLHYKLYIDGSLVDQQQVSLFGMVLGTTITLRAQLPQNKQDERPKPVKAVANIRVLSHNDYLIYVGGELIHKEQATPGGV